MNKTFSVLLSFLISQIFTIVYGLYYFDVMGSTKADCYAVAGNPNPMGIKAAKIAS